MTEIAKPFQVARLANDVISVKDFGAKGDGSTDTWLEVGRAN